MQAGNGVRGFNDGAGEGEGALDLGDDRQSHREDEPVGAPLAPSNRSGARVEAAAAAVPHELALILREELDVSCRLGRGEAGPRNGGVEGNGDLGGGAREEEDGGLRAGLYVDG